MRKLPVLLAASAAVLVGCASVGPKTVVVDRSDYGAAIAESWKQQTLLNIVKLRYMDLPVFMDVASVVAGYSLQTSVAANGFVFKGSPPAATYGSLGGSAVYTDRPTITYVPMTGEKFLRGMITPIDPKNIFFMLQSGYAADFVLGLTVESLNGVRNRSTARGVVREADPEFIRALTLMRDVQADGAMGMRVEEDKVRGGVGVVFFRRTDVSPEIAAKSAEIRRLLKLPPDADRLTLTYSPARGAGNELTVNSRSMLQIMGALASYVDVPDEHIADKSTFQAFSSKGEDLEQRARIHSGKDKPDRAYAAVRYHDYWYWVDDTDWQTKRALTAVMFFFTLIDTGAPEKLPLITIPAQ
jgi:uncharacterized protein YceK